MLPFDFNCGIGDEEEQSTFTVERVTIESILSCFKSGIGLDIAKNHTGICIWDGEKIETLGFNVDMEYEKDDYMAEAKMRRCFRQKLLEIVGGRYFEVCVIEDVYGGSNYDTVRKLLALNCVMDEIILDGLCEVDNLYRFMEPSWLKDFRTIIKVGTGLDSKYETQEILRYLEFPFFIENEKLSESKKKEIFFEDICDATAMLCSLGLRLKSEDRMTKKSSVKLSDVKMYFIEDSDDIYNLGDEVIDRYELVNPDFDGKVLEQVILNYLSIYPNKVVCLYVETKDLGTFGIKNNFTFFSQGYGYLLFYNKVLKKK